MKFIVIKFQVLMDLLILNLFVGFGIQSIKALVPNINSGKSGLHEFDLFIKNTLKCRSIPSISISMVKDDKVTFSRGYGFADINAGIKATEHTKFSIGSLTKAFTTTLLADILSKHKNISWDTPIREILGKRFRLSDEIRTNNVNLRDILAHKVGTPSNFHALLVGFPTSVTRRDLVRKLQYMPSVSDFRTDFHYSNYMYMLAGYVAEVITGASWESLVKKRLFDRLGMRDSGFVDTASGLRDMATPYVLKNKELIEVNKELLLAVSPSGPAGSIFSTASDMAKWMLFHLRKGRKGHGHGHVIVDPDYLEETYMSQVPHPFADKDLTKPTYPISDVSVSYNMGWMSSVYRGYRKLWHSGGIVTFTSQLWLFPDMNSGIFITASGPQSNQGSTAVKMISALASDILLGQTPWLNETTSCTYPEPWTRRPNTDVARDDIKYRWNISAPMTAYEGVYCHPGFGNITIKLQNGSYLVLYFGRFGEMRLQPASESIFYGFYVGRLWFITNSDDSTHPIGMEFVVTSSKINGLLFPVDFEQPKTLFSKGYISESITEDRSSPYTSVTCDSGFDIRSASSSLMVALVILHFLSVG